MAEIATVAIRMTVIRNAVHEQQIRGDSRIPVHGPTDLVPMASNRHKRLQNRGPTPASLPIAVDRSSLMIGSARSPKRPGACV